MSPPATPQLDLFRTPAHRNALPIICVEEWRDCPGFDRYEVSSLGRFRNRRTGHIMKQTLAWTGYLHVGLVRDGHQHPKLTHRLIAEAFLPRTEGQVVVNHKDRNRANNRIDNLEWCTRSHNAREAKRRG